MKMLKIGMTGDSESKK